MISLVLHTNVDLLLCYRLTAGKVKSIFKFGDQKNICQTCIEPFGICKCNI